MSVLTSVTAPAGHGDELGAERSGAGPRPGGCGLPGHGNFPPHPGFHLLLSLSPPPLSVSGPRPSARPGAARCPGADALPHRPDGAGVSPSTSKSRPEPVVVAVQQLVEDASDVFRVEVPPVALAPQRLLDAAGEASPAVSAPLQRARQTRSPRGEQGRRGGPVTPRWPPHAEGTLWGPGRWVHSPHSDADPSDEQSHASGLREDAQVPSDPSPGASLGAHPSPVGRRLRRVRTQSPAGSAPSPRPSAVLCPCWAGGGGCGCARPPVPPPLSPM